VPPLEETRTLTPGPGKGWIYTSLWPVSLGADDRRKLGAEHLDGDFAFVLEVLGEEDRGHAAPSQLPLDPVAVGERGSEERLGVGHRRPKMPGCSGLREGDALIRRSVMRRSVIRRSLSAALSTA
jgi:hypothetical protein